MNTKDLFSGHARIYAAFRPTYPEELYAYLFQLVPGVISAWDCATGNGQVAGRLASVFQSVYATDISEQQISQAVRKDNIHYSLQPAEQTDFPDKSFDLITVGQALHWFRLDAFFTEVSRTLRPGGIFAAWCYSHISISPEIDALIQKFYRDVVGPYWDDARRLVETGYDTIHFPFGLIASPEFQIKTEWTLEHLEGYLESWSATQGYIRNKGSNPVPLLMTEVLSIWKPGTLKPVSFPVSLKAARL